jgi:hypothetical protein
MPLAELPPRDSRFGSPLKLSRVHWVRPKVVVEVTYVTWTETIFGFPIRDSEKTSRQLRSCGRCRIRLVASLLSRHAYPP